MTRTEEQIMKVPSLQIQEEVGKLCIPSHRSLARIARIKSWTCPVARLTCCGPLRNESKMRRRARFLKEFCRGGEVCSSDVEVVNIVLRHHDPQRSGYPQNSGCQKVQFLSFANSGTLGDRMHLYTSTETGLSFLVLYIVQSIQIKRYSLASILELTSGNGFSRQALLALWLLCTQN